MGFATDCLSLTRRGGQEAQDQKACGEGLEQAMASAGVCGCARGDIHETHPRGRASACVSL